MSAMAGELDVNRVTLYRWIGSREAVLVDIVWGLAGADARRRLPARCAAAGPSASSRS